MIIVTGYHRSGTTAMLRALIEGTALPYIWSTEKESFIREREADPDYDPNPYGYLQNDILDLTTQDGKLFKYNLFYLTEFPKDISATVILMHRDKKEVHASYERSFGSSMPETIAMMNDLAIEALHANPNIKVIDVEFQDLMNDPESVFKKLSAHVPNLDIQKAASIIEPELYRNKKPN